ncbi:MAG: hypothetical protein M5U08_24595 [Burkholderiales bacterium]|nr:hypothetical protein [Burkholderiales bacterium]
MTPAATAVRQTSRAARIAIVLASAAALALVAALAPPLAQPEAYHAFADRRAFLGVANALDVASNLAFLVVGALGLRFVLAGARPDGVRAFQDPAERWAWGVAFAAAALTFLGSAYYHLAPDSPRLAWDRLPIAITLMGIVAAVVSERVGAQAGARLLAPLCLLGAASVWYWRWSAGGGAENLNPYAAVQFGGLLLVLLLCALFPSRYTRGGDIVGAAILYAAAKVAEHLDGAIFAATGGIVSGHTLKHLLAAAAMLWLLRMLRMRRPAGAPVP